MTSIDDLLRITPKTTKNREHHKRAYNREMASAGRAANMAELYVAEGAITTAAEKYEKAAEHLRKAHKHRDSYIFNKIPD
jgi:hypothetical protein